MPTLPCMKPTIYESIACIYKAVSNSKKQLFELSDTENNHTNSEITLEMSYIFTAKFSANN